MKKRIKALGVVRDIETFYVVRFIKDRYLLELTDEELLTTMNYLKAQRFESIPGASTAAKELFEEFDPKDLGHILSVVEVTLSKDNPLKTELRRIRVFPF